MRHIRLGNRRAQHAGESFEPLAHAAGRAPSRRTVAGLAGAAAAGALVGCTETRPAQGNAATLATVRGRISGRGVTNFSGSIVMLHGITDSKSAYMTPVSATGHYLISNVRPGKWLAVCVPGLGIPLAAVTYKGLAGYPKTGTVIRITGAENVDADFALPAAGNLQVIVKNKAATPVSGAMAWVFEAGANVPAGAPVTTDSSGTAHLTQVPITSKVFIIHPARKASVWWDGAQSWKAARTITLPGQGQGISISVTLPER